MVHKLLPLRQFLLRLPMLIPQQQKVKQPKAQAEPVRKPEPVVQRMENEERKVVNGNTVSYGGMRYTATPVEPQQTARPQFTVHTGKAAQAQSLMIKLYTPRNFDQVTEVADDIKGKRAVIINYDKVDLSEQRRICDFVNGVCYVTNGDARRISNNIVLYVPDGVDAEEAMTMAMTH